MKFKNNKFLLSALALVYNFLYVHSQGSGVLPTGASGVPPSGAPPSGSAPGPKANSGLLPEQ